MLVEQALLQVREVFGQGKLSALEPAPRFILERRLRQNWRTITVTTPMAQDRKESIEQKQRLWVVFLPMPLGCTICMGMCGSGAWIIGMVLIRMPQRMAAPGSIWMRQPMLVECCGAVRGATIPGIAALPRATTSIRGLTTSASVFGLSVRLPGLYSPLLCCLFAICACFFSLLLFLLRAWRDHFLA